jgi:hypothetical protein
MRRCANVYSSLPAQGLPAEVVLIAKQTQLQVVGPGAALYVPGSSTHSHAGTGAGQHALVGGLQPAEQAADAATRPTMTSQDQHWAKCWSRADEGCLLKSCVQNRVY